MILSATDSCFGRSSYRSRVSGGHRNFLSLRGNLRIRCHVHSLILFLNLIIVLLGKRKRRTWFDVMFYLWRKKREKYSILSLPLAIIPAYMSISIIFFLCLYIPFEVSIMCYCIVL